MNSILDYYQHLPFHIQPDIPMFGSFSVSWYSIMYLIAFLVVFFLVRYRMRREEISNFEFQISKLNQNSKFKIQNSKVYDSLLIDFLLYAFIGLLVGARLGEVFIYDFNYYFHNPLAIVSPFDPATGKFVGIYGMSYHGGLVGVLVFGWIWGRRNKINLWNWANLIAPAVSLGYFFGRIGNFINGELYGRVTPHWWGMYFPQSTETRFSAPLQLRHPSQLYEAFLEGILLFAILWLIRNRSWAKDKIVILYIIGYALMRFIAEFWREPDAMVGKYLSIGQVLSLFMMLGAAAFLVFKKSGIMKQEKRETKIN